MLFQLTSMFTFVAILCGFKTDKMNENAAKILEVKINVILIYTIGLILFIITKLI